MSFSRFMSYAVGLAILIPVLIFLVSIILFPVHVAQRALDPGSAILKYEFFHDANNAILSRRAQIASHKQLITIMISVPEEANRLRIELAGMQQSCRDLVSKYNANAQKVNHTIFRGTTTPSNISINSCE